MPQLLGGGGTDLSKNIANKSVASDTEIITTNKTNDAEMAARKTAENAINNAHGVMAENNAVNDTAKNAVKDAVKDAKIVKTVAMLSADKKVAGNVSDEKMGAQNADKNTTTQSFNVEKNKDVANANQLMMLKADTQNTYAWDDTSDAAMIARGYHKTAAGWTKANPKTDYDTVAKSSTIKLDFDPNYTYGYDNDWKASTNTLHQNSQDNAIDMGATFNFDIDKGDLKKGNRILLGTVVTLDNSKFEYPLSPNANGSVYDVHDDTSKQTLGSVHTQLINGKYTFTFVVAEDDNFANDLKLDFHVSHILRGIAEVLPHAPKDDPYKAKFITLGNNEINYSYYFIPTKYATGDYIPDNTDVHPDSGSLDMQWNAYNVTTGNKGYHRVIKFIGLNKDNPVDMSDGSYWRVNEEPFYHLFDENGKVISNEGLPGWLQATSADSLIHAADNMSANDLYNATKDNQILVSKQSDGSFLVSYKLSDDIDKLTQDDLTKRIKYSQWWFGSGASDAEKEKVLNNTISHYQKTNFAPEGYWISQIFHYDKTKPFAIALTDVTPNASYKLHSLTGTFTPEGLKSIDMSMYRTYNVQYKDEVTGKVVANDVIMSETGQDINYKYQTSNNYRMAPNAKVIVDGVDHSFDNGSILHFVIPQDEKKDPDPIIINVLGKEDYERDRTYTVVTQKPDHNGGTADSTYATYTMKMTRNVTGRDGSGKVTFDNWKMTDGNGVTYTYDPSNSVWLASNSSKVTDIVLGTTTNAPKDADFAVDGYTAHSDIAIDGIDLPSFADKLANPKDKIEITQNGQLLIHTSDFANPDKTLPSGSFYIKYTANPQKVVYQFIDDDNNKQQFGSDIVLNGVTDQTVATGLKVPANYYVASGTSVPANYKFGATNQSPIEIHLKHVLTDITDQARLHSASTRTFYVTYPNGRKPETIIQIIGVARTGQHDTVTGQDSFTAWVLDSGASKVTVNGQDSTNYAAYDPASKSPRFASITLPRIPGYTAKIKQNPQNKMMYLVSFVAIPTPNTPNKGDDKVDDNKTTVDQGQTIVANKGQDKIHDNDHGSITIDVPSDNKDNRNETVIPSTPSIINTDNNKDNNKDEHDWTINSIKSSDYVISNGADNYTLPIIDNTGLSIIKTSDNTLAFTYIKLNTPSDYVFTLTKRHKLYQLKVGKVINGKLTTIKTFKSRNYKDLMKELKKMYL